MDPYQPPLVPTQYGILDERPLRAGQILGLILCSLVSGSLSLIGSTCIIVGLRKKYDNTYARLMIGLSAADIVTTLALMNMSWALPSDAQSPFAVGTTVTCNAAGFFFIFLLASAAYSAFVSLYFLLTVKHQYTQRDFRRLEPIFHAIAWSAPVILGTAGLLLEGFNVPQLGHMCSFATGPPSCRLPINDSGEKISCSRGRYTNELGGTFQASLMLCALAGIVNTILLYISITKTHANNRRHSFGSQLSESRDWRDRLCFQQAALYVVSYVNSFLWYGMKALLTTILPYETVRQPSRALVFLPILLGSICMPLQGFFNAIIFFTPRVQHWSRSNPSKSWWWCIRRVLSGEEAPRRSSRASSRASSLGLTRVDSARREEERGQGFLSSAARRESGKAQGKEPPPEDPDKTNDTTGNDTESPASPHGDHDSVASVIQVSGILARESTAF